MANCFILIAAGFALSIAPDGVDQPKFHFVDLRPNANFKLNDNFGTGREGNNLSSLKRNEQEFEGVTFKIADSFLQLGSKLLKEPKPDKVEGIKVDKKFSRLHLLQATGYGSNQRGLAIEEDPNFISDDIQIAEYRIHYENGTIEKVPVIYGKDVRDWWFRDTDKGVSKGKIAWRGENEVAKQSGKKIRLYVSSWKNPHPEMKVTSIDFVKVGDTPAGPFCVAITVEE